MAQGDEIDTVLPNPGSQLPLQTQERPDWVPSIGVMGDAEEVCIVIVQEVLYNVKGKHLACRSDEDVRCRIILKPCRKRISVLDLELIGDAQAIVDGFAAKSIRMELKYCDLGVGILAPCLEQSGNDLVVGCGVLGNDYA